MSIKPACCHKVSWHDFIAGRDKDHTVKLMSFNHNFDCILNNLSARQGIFHALVSHCDSVANPYGMKFKRNSPSVSDSGFHGFCKFIQVNMARNYVVPGIDDCDERPLHLGICDPSRFQE